MKIRKLLKSLCLGLLMGLCASLVLTLFGVEITGYVLATFLYAGVFINIEYGHYKAGKQKREEYEALDEFLSEIRHSYYVHGMVDEAVLDVAEGLNEGYMKREAVAILEVLNADEPLAAADNYRRGKSNRYLKLFTTLCLTVLEYGDKTLKEGSLFLANLMQLKEEIRAELEADMKLQSKMTGMGLVAAAPAFFLKIIENWGTSNLPELKAYYESRGGITLMAGLFCLSVAVYAVLCILRQIRKDDELVKSGLHRLAGLPAMHAFLYKLEHLFEKSSRHLRSLLYEAGESRNVGELYLEKLGLALGLYFTFGTAGIVNALQGREGISLAFTVILTLIAFFIPDILLYIKRFLNRISMEEEVMQYHTIITMLMYLERISVYEILEELEQFARIFKKSISNCLNEYHSGEERALWDMHNREGCRAFRNLVDKLLLCDKIGVRAAFDEIQADHTFYVKKRAMRSEENIHKKAVLGQFMAFIPLTLSIALYLIIPFASESLKMLAEISRDINF